VDLNLIRLFDFYLALMFLISTVLRVRQYRAILALISNVPGRWPRLFDLVKQHRAIFLTGSTLAPAALALVLLAIQMFASRRVWPEAGEPPYGLTLGRLLEQSVATFIVAGCTLTMLAVDLYATFAVGELDHRELAKYFDQAEYWLNGWRAPVVRVFTLGYINPRQMVHSEVRSALISASQILNSTLWWVSLQTGLRIVSGLSLWLTYAWTRV
jgi:hypothetical protein